MDIVGPMNGSEGYRYCLALIDRFSRWTEAIPLKDLRISRILATDQETQCESLLLTALLSLIGCQRIRTTAYHPSANGINAGTVA